MKKKLALLGTAIISLALVASLSFAWFVSTIDPIDVSVTSAKIQVTSTYDGSAWRIDDNGDLDKVYPGESLKYAGDFTITNSSTREALAKLSIDIKGTLIISNQAPNMEQYIKNTKVLLEQEGYDVNTWFKGDKLTIDRDFMAAFEDSTADSANWEVLRTGVSDPDPSDSYNAVSIAYTHFWSVLNTVANSFQTDSIKTAIDGAGLIAVPFGLDDKPLTNPGVICGYYVGMPNPGSTPQVVKFDNLGFKVPADLGGNLLTEQSALKDAASQAYSLKDLSNFGIQESAYESNLINEQEAVVGFEFNLKVVQGTKSAVMDVFNFDNDEYAALGSVITNDILTDW